MSKHWAWNWFFEEPMDTQSLPNPGIDKKWKIWQNGYGWHLERWEGDYFMPISHYVTTSGHFTHPIFTYQSRQECLDQIKLTEEYEAKERAQSKIKHVEYM